MKVNVSDIIRINGASMQVDFIEEPSEKELAHGCVLDDKIRFSGTLTNELGTLHLEGRLQLNYGCECFRCLKPASKGLDIKISEGFIGSDKAEQSDLYPFEGKILDTDKALRDNIILSLPMKNLCSEECKGLCEKCGANLNEMQCGCVDDTIDPRLEGLSKFFE
jgi:uncharacterized protein